MRALAAAVVLLTGTGAAALPWEAGLDGGLLLRQEAGGDRSVLPAGTLRGAVGLLPGLDAGFAWTFARASGGGAVAGVTTQHHRFALRAEYALPVRKAELVFALAPALVLMHTDLYDRDRLVQSVTLPRVGVQGGVALQVPFERFAVRTGADLISTWDRWDFLFTVGASWRAADVR